MNIFKQLSSTRIITAFFGIIIGISGFNHGLFETLQGNKKISGLIIQSIGETNRMWLHGTEEAFTIIPNYLVTGVCAMIIALIIIVWSVLFIERKYGRIIFLLLCFMLFCTGGGIAQIIFFVPIFGYATRIGKPLNWWRKILPKGIELKFARLWLIPTILFCIFFLISLEIAIFGYFPYVKSPETLLYVCWSFLLISFLLLHISYILGFINEINQVNIKNKLD